MRIAAVLLPSCREVTARLGDHLEGRLNLGRRLGVRLHLGWCPSCRHLLQNLQALPSLVRKALEPVPAAPPASAVAVLDRAIARFGQPRSRPQDPRFGVPEPFADALATGRISPTLAILAAAHRQLVADGPPAAAPFLPAEALNLLPPAAAWRWLPSALPGLRIARLATDAEATLYLLALKADRRIPRHTHGGRESTLLLQGGLEDGDRHHGPGEWVVHEGDHRHAPAADGQGCWALARLEGAPRFTGLLGLLQRMSA